MPRGQARGTPLRGPSTAFLETVDGKPTLFAYEAVGEPPVKSTRNRSVLLGKSGWLVVRFKLDTLKEHSVVPLLADFVRDQGGTVKSHHAHFTLGEPEGHPGVKAVVSFPISRGKA